MCGWVGGSAGGGCGDCGGRVGLSSWCCLAAVEQRGFILVRSRTLRSLHTHLLTHVLRCCPARISPVNPSLHLPSVSSVHTRTCTSSHAHGTPIAYSTHPPTRSPAQLPRRIYSLHLSPPLSFLPKLCCVSLSSSHCFALNPLPFLFFSVPSLPTSTPPPPPPPPLQPPPRSSLSITASLSW